ncbi:unnamed protein product [Symbiodinium necroappetens]|uniref:Uncharacterized protein n=1 Tax=Symbiodinium necroappetens TaxID=1628268 RepID=A0A812VRR2_9DINO|nr:unnamed protein product [Symbiodinium necroappetens]
MEIPSTISSSIVDAFTVPANAENMSIYVPGLEILDEISDSGLPPATPFGFTFLSEEDQPTVDRMLVDGEETFNISLGAVVELIGRNFDGLLGSEVKAEGKAAHSKASIFYGADEYLEELKKKYEHDHEIAALKNALPGEGDPNAAGVAQSSDKMLSVQKNNENRSLKTNRLFPTPNKPDPMPQNLAFLFTKITPEQMIYMPALSYLGNVLHVCEYLNPRRNTGNRSK